MTKSEKFEAFRSDLEALCEEHEIKYIEFISEYPSITWNDGSWGIISDNGYCDCFPFSESARLIDESEDLDDKSTKHDASEPKYCLCCKRAPCFCFSDEDGLDRDGDH